MPATAGTPAPAADDPDAPGPASLATYAQEVTKAAAAKRSELKLMRDSHEATQQVSNLLATLPGKLRHPVMVPFGRHAFFPGHLVHTNELVVHLGGQYYAEMTAAAARDSLRRRGEAVADGISKAEEQLRALEARMEVSRAALGGGGPGAMEEGGLEGPLQEIRETEEESEAWIGELQGPRAAAGAPESLGGGSGSSGSGSSGSGGGCLELQGQALGRSSAPPAVHQTAAAPRAAALGSGTSSENGQDDAANGEEDYWDALMRAEQKAEEEGLGEEEAERRAQQLLKRHAKHNSSSGDVAVDAAAAGPSAPEGEDELTIEEPAAAPSATVDVAAGAAAAGSAAIDGSSGGGSTGGSVRRVSWGALEQRLAAQEGEADSDDDDDYDEGPVPSLVMGKSAKQQQQQQQPVPSAQASTAAAPKSILKKGFLGGSPAGGTAKRAQSTATSAGRQAAAAAAAAKGRPASRAVEVPLIGEVVERSADDSQAVAQGDAGIVGSMVGVHRQVAGGQVATAPAPAAAPAEPPKRMSRFKMQRLGLQAGDGDVAG